MVQQKGGRFILSDDKIKELAAAGLTSDNYKADPRYYRNIPEQIIINSDIEKISKIDTDYSLYGLIYKITLKDGVESPLVKLNIDEGTPDHGDLGKTSCSINTFFRKHCLKSVRTFLLKVSILSDAGEIEICSNPEKLTAKKSEFIKEANVQNSIYEKTFDYGESVVPACIAPPIIDPIEQHDTIHPILTKLLEPEIDDDGWLKFLLKSSKKRGVNDFGIIFMEYAEGYRTLSAILNDEASSSGQKLKATFLAKAAHVVLYEKGIAQGDSHNQNVMVNLNYVGFLGHGHRGKALIIDFGRAKDITKADIDRFGLGTLTPTEEEYNNVYHYLKWVSNNRGRWDHPPYDWLTEINFGDESVMVKTLLDLRNQRSKTIKEKLEAALPNLIKREFLFAEFLNKTDFNNFMNLRWHDVILPYDYDRKAPGTPPLAKSPANNVLPPVKYRGIVRVSPYSSPVSNPKSIHSAVLPPAPAPHVVKVGQPLPPVKLRGKNKKAGGTKNNRKARRKTRKHRGGSTVYTTSGNLEKLNEKYEGKDFFRKMLSSIVEPKIAAILQKKPPSKYS